MSNLLSPWHFQESHWKFSIPKKWNLHIVLQIVSVQAWSQCSLKGNLSFLPEKGNLLANVYWNASADFLGIWEGSDDIRHIMPVRAHQITFLSLVLDLYCNTAYKAVKVVTTKRKVWNKMHFRICQHVQNFVLQKSCVQWSHACLFVGRW